MNKNEINIIIQMIEDQKNNINQRFDTMDNKINGLHHDFKGLSNDITILKNNFNWIKIIGYSFFVILVALIPIYF